MKILYQSPLVCREFLKSLVFYSRRNIYILEREGWNRSLNKNAKNITEREGRSSTQNGTERDGTERERNYKKKSNENGTIKLKPLVLERNGTISKKSERAQP